MSTEDSLMKQTDQKKYSRRKLGKVSVGFVCIGFNFTDKTYIEISAAPRNHKHNIYGYVQSIPTHILIGYFLNRKWLRSQAAAPNVSILLFYNSMAQCPPRRNLRLNYILGRNVVAKMRNDIWRRKSTHTINGWNLFNVSKCDIASAFCSDFWLQSIRIHIRPHHLLALGYIRFDLNLSVPAERCVECTAKRSIGTMSEVEIHYSFHSSGWP